MINTLIMRDHWVSTVCKPPTDHVISLGFFLILLLIIWDHWVSICSSNLWSEIIGFLNNPPTDHFSFSPCNQKTHTHPLHQTRYYHPPRSTAKSPKTTPTPHSRAQPLHQKIHTPLLNTNTKTRCPSPYSPYPNPTNPYFTQNHSNLF